MRIPRKPLGDEIYKRLLNGVMSGRFPAGSRMGEERLCRMLGVSRTPLREAMIRLTREGVLEKRPNCGCVVRGQRADELRELLEGRRLLECLALREWFSKLDLAAFKDMAERLRKAEKSSPAALRDEILRTDEELHELIVSVCANRFVADHIRHLQLLCRPYRVHRCSVSEDVKAILLERRRIIQAILAGDVEGAAAGLSEHFACSIRHYMRSARDTIER